MLRIGGRRGTVEQFCNDYGETIQSLLVLDTISHTCAGCATLGILSADATVDIFYSTYGNIPFASVSVFTTPEVNVALEVWKGRCIAALAQAPQLIRYSQMTNMTLDNCQVTRCYECV